MAKGLGMMNAYTTVNSSSSTTASGVAASGQYTIQLHFNSIGTTINTTLVGLQLPPSLPQSLFLTQCQGNNDSGFMGMYLAYLYKIGTLDLSAVGNRLTHDAATFPVLRTQFGEASKPLSLTPIIYVTTATTVTAAVFGLRTNAGAAGYTNQDGSAVIGTDSNFTMPAAATAINSAFILRLNAGDSGVRDINQININTKATAGAASIFGAELLAPLSQIADQTNFVCDSLFGGFAPMDLKPAVATSGTATSYLSIITMNRTSGGIHTTPIIMGVLNS